MKKAFLCLVIFSLFIPTAFAVSKDSTTTTVKGFYVGMERSEVKKIYEQFKKDKIASHLNFEKENYRDLIMVDNEFSSMSNKIEVAYDENYKATGITFQYKTVPILFESGKLGAEEFVKKFVEEYKLPEMKYEDMGMFKMWSVILDTLKIKVSIDDYKNIRIQKVKK